MNITFVSDDGLGSLVAHIGIKKFFYHNTSKYFYLSYCFSVTNYLARFYTICVFWHLHNFDHIVNSFMQNMPINDFKSFDLEYPTFHLYKFKEFDNRRKIVLTAINDGCQVICKMQL